MICITFRRAASDQRQRSNGEHRSETSDVGPRSRRALAGSASRRLFLALSIVLLLAGCAEESTEDRRFANEPVPTEDRPTATVAPTEVETGIEPTVIAASPESLLSTRGAPTRIYAVIGGELWMIGDEQPRRLTLPAGQSVLDVDGSPSGDRVAVVARDERGATNLLILDAGGALVRSVPNVLAQTNARAATPMAKTSGEMGVVVDWGLQGDTILVGTGSGQLTAVPIDGEPRPVTVDVEGIEGGALMEARLSPSGDSIAVLRRDAEGVGRLVVVPLDDDSGAAARAIAPRGQGGQQTVLDMAWLPDGGSLLYIEGPVAGEDTQVEGDLFLVNLAGLERNLVATGGKAGPAGSILAAQPSADGKSVAYVIGIPEGNGWTAHSAWIASLQGPTEYQLPAENVADVTGIWWTRDGVVWAERLPVEGNGSEIVVRRIGEDAVAREILRVSQAPQPATPTSATPEPSSPATPLADATPNPP